MRTPLSASVCLVVIMDKRAVRRSRYHNEGHVLTPTMDRLATKEGVRLERHYAFQWCAPSRASLLTGRESYHVLEGGGGVDSLPTAVTRGMTMLPKKLQSVGYTTHQIGKWQ